MTPKEKAIDLVLKFSFLQEPSNKTKQKGNPPLLLKPAAKACVMIMVDEILNGAHLWQHIEGKERVFWNQVKHEIENL